MDFEDLDFVNNNENVSNNSIDKLNNENCNELEERKDFVKQFVNDIHQKFDEMKSHITLVIDRIEGDIAVCENRETEEITNINVSELPEDIHEGDVLKLNENENKYEIDEQTRLEIQERIKSKIRNIFEETEDE